MRIARSALVGLLRFLVAIPVTMLEALDPQPRGSGGHAPPTWGKPPTQAPTRQAIISGPMPHGGVCASCGAGMAWRYGSQPEHCSCGGEIDVLA